MIWSLGFGLRLLHQFSDRVLQIVDLLTHVVDTRHNIIIHLGEALLHLAQHRLYELSQVLGVVNICNRVLVITVLVR